MLKYTEKLAKELSEKVSWFQIKEIGENGSFKVVASDETTDRVGEVIKVTGRELENYRKNPIILFWHKYSDMDDIIWKATNVYIEWSQLIVEWNFASTYSAQTVRKLYDEWVLKTVSVGFIAKERDANDRNIITRAELLELSFVPVPCNPNALTLWKEVLEDLISKGFIIKESDNTNQNTESPNSTEEAGNPNEEAEQQETCEEENENKETDDQENSLDNEEEKTIKEMTEVNLEKDIYDQLKDAIREKMNSKYLYVVEIYTKHFIFRDDVNWKYFDQNWKIKWESAVLDGDAVEVQPNTVWIAKTIQKSNRELLDEIKSWLSNDKDETAEDDDLQAKMKMQKEALQNVSKVVSDVLHKIKL